MLKLTAFKFGKRYFLMSETSKHKFFVQRVNPSIKNRFLIHELNKPKWVKRSENRFMRAGKL